MRVQVLPIESVVSDPSIRGGRPIIAGTGLRVSDVVCWHLYKGLSVEQIAEDFRIGLANTHAALAYYYLHRDEIEAEITENDDGIAHGACEERLARKEAA